MQQRAWTAWQRNLGLVVLIVSAVSAAPAQQLQVNSADPPAAEQGTVNLNVTIGGKGFKKGAAASFVLSGTDDADGITVNSTTFVGATTLVANITVADTATIAKFDIKVRNSDGRIGKGTELFSVLAKGTGQDSTCATQGTPAGWVVVEGLQRTNPDGTGEFTSQGFGVAVRARAADLDGNGSVDAIVVMAVAGQGTGVVNFLLDPVTGQRLSASVVASDLGSGLLSVGEVNGDGIPDFAMTNGLSERAFVFLSNMSGGQLTYSRIQLDRPTDIALAAFFGSFVALGDLDGDGTDELAVSASGQGIHGNKNPGTTVIYRFESGSFVRKVVIVDPLPNRRKNSEFGAVAIGNVTGDASADLVIGQSAGEVDGVSEAGRVYVFPGPVLSPSFDPSSYVTLTLPGALMFGFKVGVGNVDGVGIPDVVATTKYNSFGDTEQAAVFSGPVSTGQTPTYRLMPRAGA
ncbi:MAG TPA: VCBS repeat-containing protein, partial [Terriglobales bacterium]|nr:VCBS repeat-containing protein [Terriglobales bacterium]